MDDRRIHINQLYGLIPIDIEGIDALIELALDMQWSWNHAADKIWQRLDSALWDFTHNPWVVLQTVSRDQLEQQLADPDFRHNIDELIESKDSRNPAPAWFRQTYPDASLSQVAYFSMEFMLSEALPIYVGGLGNVAGDQLKAASDMGVPVVAVGLLFQQGYFHQVIDDNGFQQALFPYNDPGQLPITPLRLPNGEWLRLKIALPDYPVWLRTWQVQMGRVKLYLLDSNDPANMAVHRDITSELYGGGADMRIKQEILLGIGGWKLLKTLGIKPEVCHMNEGHAAFLVLERARDFMEETGLPFDAALAVTRAGNLFTTHTAVAAGFDHFSPPLMEQFLGDYAKNELHIAFNDLMALGRQDPDNLSESFNMAYLAVRGSGAVNGVSSLHSEVSRHVFQPIFPRWPTDEVPIGAVTNGVHMPSWDSEFADEIWTKACGKDRWKGELETLEEDICRIPDEKLWEFRNRSRRELVNFIWKRTERQATVSSHVSGVTEPSKYIFNPDVLTLGFARRFVPYKRPNLLLHHPERLLAILTDADRPVQLVIAGKAPPFDDAGKALIHEWVQFIRQYQLQEHVVFLNDYDMLLTENMVQGVDVWLNTPRRPWEACGTSGMKVLVNGGINLSELDGWWAEAYTPNVGWALGDRKEHGDDPDWDAQEAEALYDLLEQQVIPEFYDRPNGIPGRWVERMRKSMATLTPVYSANRTVREYTERYYLPAAAEYLQRADQKGAEGMRIMNMLRDCKRKWERITFRKRQVEPIKQGFLLCIPVILNELPPGSVRVELYANGMEGGAAERIPMQQFSATDDEKGYLYRAQVITNRPADDYTVRIIPADGHVSAPLENHHILWEH